MNQLRVGPIGLYGVGSVLHLDRLIINVIITSVIELLNLFVLLFCLVNSNPSALCHQIMVSWSMLMGCHCAILIHAVCLAVAKFGKPHL